MIKTLYPTYEEACRSARKLGVSNATGYKARYKKDSRLPASPDKYYQDEWIIYGRWEGFLNGWCFRTLSPKAIILGSDGLYNCYEDASNASQKYGVRSRSHYLDVCDDHPFLPSYPETKYKELWKERGGWPGFLGSDRSYYPSVKEMKAAVIKLGINSSNDYRKRYSEDPRLHRYPHILYGEQWIESGRWLYIFDRRSIMGESLSFYPTIADAAQVARDLEITSRKEYRKRYKEDPKLPSTPETTYKEDWKAFGGWFSFLGTNKRSHISKYENIHEAAKASRAIGFKSAQEYRNGYKQDPLLPCAPDQFYREDWDSNGKWDAFTV